MNIMQAENVKRIPYAEKAPVEAFRSGANPPVPAVMSPRARERPSAAGFRFTRQEISGSLGDLGTFLPLTLGYITQCGLSPAPVFFFAGLWNVATGLLFRLPIPVQPMKAIAAVAITEGMTPGEVASAGIFMGAILFLIGMLFRVLFNGKNPEGDLA